MMLRGVLALRTRVILLVLALDVAVVAGYASLTLWHTRAGLLESFDAALAAQAEALASRLEVERDGTIEFEHAGAGPGTPSPAMAPIRFLIRDGAGRLVASDRESPPGLLESLGRLPPGRHDMTTDLGPHRILAMAALARRERPVPGEPGVPVTITVAANRSGLDAEVARFLRFLLMAGAAATLASIAGAAWIARVALSPLDALVLRLRSTDARSLHARLPTQAYPLELRPLVAAFNRLFEDLEEAFGRERQFSADAAHELRTPVAILKSGIQAALLAPREPQADRATLQDLLRDTERLELLCESLLQLGGGGDHEPQELDLRDLLQLVGDAARGAPTTRSGQPLVLRVESEQAGGNGRALMDEWDARRILANLLSNAACHGASSVLVRAEPSPDGGTLRVLIEDDGPGIPAEFQRRLFARFARADPSRSRGSGGAGLGLAICKELALRNGGGIEHDPDFTRGARFVWTIRMVPPGAVARGEGENGHARTPPASLLDPPGRPD